MNENREECELTINTQKTKVLAFSEESSKPRSNIISGTLDEMLTTTQKKAYRKQLYPIKNYLPEYDYKR